jgi:hypothetical protein
MHENGSFLALLFLYFNWEVEFHENYISQSIGSIDFTNQDPETPKTTSRSGVILFIMVLFALLKPCPIGVCN